MTTSTNLTLHWWVAEGTGEITRNWFNPVCDRTIRRKFPEAVRGLLTPPDGATVCAACAEVAAAR